jgi:hypothetical protein
MNRIRRRSPPPHIVICDTNILWHEDKTHAVNPVFDDFWRKYSEVFPMKLIVPDIVRGELLFQQTTSACKSLKKANTLFDELTGITERSYSHRVTEEKVIGHVKERFERWLQSKQAEVKSCPLAEIDWERLIQLAVWRRPPFSFDPQTPKNEKGFRDALILETVAVVCNEAAGQKTVAFICADNLLRSASEERLGHLKHLTVYESLLEFESFIQLTQQNLTNEFVKGILSRAKTKFFEVGNRESLYYKADLGRTLAEKYKSELETPSDVFTFPSLGSAFSSVWKNAAELRRIGPPEFANLVHPNEYHWITKITFSRLLERPTFLGSPAGQEYRKVVLVAKVLWKAAVRSDGRFFDCELISDSLDNVSSTSPTDEDLERFGVHKKIPPPL